MCVKAVAAHFTRGGALTGPIRVAAPPRAGAGAAHLHADARLVFNRVARAHAPGLRACLCSEAPHVTARCVLCVCVCCVLLGVCAGRPLLVLRFV